MWDMIYNIFSAPILNPFHKVVVCKWTEKGYHITFLHVVNYEIENLYF